MQKLDLEFGEELKWTSDKEFKKGIDQSRRDLTRLLYHPEVVQKGADATATVELVIAIDDRSVENVRSAINAKADVDANNLIQHPIWQTAVFNSGYKYEEQSFEDRLIHSQILNLIIPKVKTILEPMYEGYEEPNVHRAFDLKNVETAALIVLRAIKQASDEGFDYIIDLKQIFSGIGDGVFTGQKDRENKAQNIATVHDLVGKKLSDPKTEFEQDVSISLSDQARRYWTTPLPVDPNILPHPSPELVAVRRRAKIGLDKINAKYGSHYGSQPAL